MRGDAEGADVSPGDSFEKLCLEFDGHRLLIRTDIPGLPDSVREDYRPMLVQDAGEAADELVFHGIENGFAVGGPAGFEILGRDFDYLTAVLRLQVLDRFLVGRPDLLWVHGGAVERGGSALVIAAPPASGKSTLVAELCGRGWGFLSDDVAPVRPGTEEVLPFPQAPFRRVHPGREVEQDAARSLSREPVTIPTERVVREPLPIRAIVFPVFRYDASAELSRLRDGDGAWRLIMNCTNLPAHKQEAVANAAMLARNVPFFELSFSQPGDAAILLESLADSPGD